MPIHQDSMATAFPIYCVIQSLEFVGIFSKENNSNCITQTVLLKQNIFITC